jgi:transcriptional regulator with XRE-family HTH domain
MKAFLKLHACRDNAELSQEELAVKLGVSVGTIKNWENYKTEIPAPKLVQLAELANCPIDCILLYPYTLPKQ